MATDNVDIWKKVVFSIPSTDNIVLGSVVLGAIYSILTYLGLKAFTSISLQISVIPFIAVFLFILPTLVSGELLHRFIPNYPRKWGYFLAFCNLNVLFIYSMILTGADNFLNGWNILWLAVITVYLSNFLVLMLTIGYKHIRRVSLLSFIQPLLILTAFHVFLGRALQIPLLTYLTNFAVLIFAGFLLVIAFLAAEFFIRTNVPNVSVLGLTSGLLQKKQQALDLGYTTKPDVQTLKIRNSTDTATIAIPWIHPGPLEGFGGGEITTNIIESLNQEDKGFFFHVPSTHKSDPVNPAAYKKILNAIDDPETVSQASKLLKKQYGDIVFYGRKLNGKKIVYMDASEFGNYDDYELSIFREIINPEETVIVDLHNHKRELQGKREEVWYNTETAELLRNYFRDFLDELESEKLYDYNAGFEVSEDSTQIFSNVESVDGQQTLLFGIEGNEAGKELQQLQEEYEKDFDEVVMFTTDTHQSIHELSQDKQVEPEKVRRVVEKARNNLSPAQIGFSSQKAEKMKLLQEDYSGLVFSINILVRLIPLTLVILYLMLIVWVL
jgi:putative membrane protein